MDIKIFQDEESFSSNTYVITKGTKVIVVDPGYYDEELKKYLKLKGHVDMVLLTHGHFDHIAGIDSLKRDFPKALIYIHKDDYDFLKNSYLNCSLIMSAELVVESEVNKIETEKLNLGDIEIDVINTPGHTQGSVCFYFKQDKVLFTGDTIIGNSIGVTHMPTGNAEKIKESLKKFINLNCKDETLIYSGHGKIMTYKEVLNNNEYIKEYLS